MAWLHEFPETSENVNGSSQRRWTSKIPVVSSVLLRPSASSVLRRKHQRHRDSQVLNDAAVTIELAWHSKTPNSSQRTEASAIALISISPLKFQKHPRMFKSPHKTAGHQRSRWYLLYFQALLLLPFSEENIGGVCTLKYWTMPPQSLKQQSVRKRCVISQVTLASTVHL
jgi:hypothetical protein